MPTKLTLEEILEKNPYLNMDDIKRDQELYEKLSESDTGSAKRQYVTSERHRVRLDDSNDSDPRVVYLRNCHTRI